MKKNIFIHIGTGKTGTTAIQDFLSKNNTYLKRYDLKYCTSGRTKINHHYLCRNYLRNENNFSTKHLNNLRKEIKNSEINNFLISSEYFPGLNKYEVKEIYTYLNDICKINIVVYLRRQDEFVESWYAQVIKAHKKDFDIINLLNNLKKNKILDYEDLIDRWDIEEYKPKIIVRTYEKEEFPNNNVVYDFMNIFKLKDIPLSRKKGGISNKSISREQVLFKKNLIKYCDSKQQQFLSNPFNIKSDFMFFLPPNTRHEILQNYKEII